jgi:Transposase DDE domain
MKTINNDQDNVTILTEIFVEVCEFMKTFESVFEQHLIGERRQRPFCRLDICEIMTILIGYQTIGGQNFKQYYKDTILQFHRKEFPDLVSYQRFVEIAPIATIPLSMFLKFGIEMSEKTGLYAIDSTPLCVCENIRIPRHEVFKELAQRGKTSIGWFYGFKLHLVINHLGELMAVHITAGNIDDRKPVSKMVKTLEGKLLGDKGYIWKELVKELFEQGLEFITTIKKNMKQNLSAFDRILLRKRAVIETANDLLKNYFQAEHSRHRSAAGFMNNVLSALIAYTFYPTKPKMRGVGIQLPIITK